MTKIYKATSDLNKKFIKRPRYRISPELVDGDHWSIVDHKDTLLDIISCWCKDSGEEPGEGFSVRVVMLSDAEIAALPEV